MRLRARDKRDSSSTLVLMDAILFSSKEDLLGDGLRDWASRSQGVWCNNDGVCAALALAVARMKAEADVFAAASRSHTPTPMPKRWICVRECECVE